MVTILTSTNIEELYLFKEILEQNNIVCKIENKSIQVHQFYTSSGAKLLISDYDTYDAQILLKKYGNNQADAAINIGVEISEDELRLKGKLRELNDINSIDELRMIYSSKRLNPQTIATIFDEEKQYIIHRNKNKFDLNEFLANLFEGKLFEYLNRNKSTKYEIENELIERLEISDKSDY